MVSTALPSFRSRTVPTKQATAPTLGFCARKAATSVVRSKSSVWTRTVMPSTSTARYGRKERDLAAFGNAGAGVGHPVIAGHAQRAPLGERLRPDAAARPQPHPHVAHRGHAVGHIDRFVGGTECFTHACKKFQLDLHLGRRRTLPASVQQFGKGNEMHGLAGADHMI